MRIQREEMDHLLQDNAYDEAQCGDSLSNHSVSGSVQRSGFGSLARKTIAKLNRLSNKPRADSARLSLRTRAIPVHQPGHRPPPKTRTSAMGFPLRRRRRAQAPRRPHLGTMRPTRLKRRFEQR